MKTFSEFINYLYESEPSSLTNHRDGKPILTMKHYDNDEMVRFLKSPEGANHSFIGHDAGGKPHTARMY